MNQTIMMNMPQSIEEKINYAFMLKEEGNVFFTSGEYQKAIGKYTKIQLYLNGLGNNETVSQMKSMLNRPDEAIENVSNEENVRIKSIQLSGFLNLAACYLKLMNYGKAIEYATKVLAMDEKNSKALFRRAQAYNGMKDADRALDDLNMAVKICPNDAGICEL